MRDGIARHERLEHEDHDVVEIIVKTREDNLGVRLVNGIISFRDLLPTNKKVREVWILGTPTVHEDKKCIVRGIVDEFALERSGHGEVVSGCMCGCLGRVGKSNSMWHSMHRW
eukprot:Blabericola_migrator_1__1030@NODE_125_length_13349_cov_24_985168_g111_i0_p6_GENE_NODE_125_length_13349_cov_24_985168_g111_i0NODE_125_length_13349_cov_24_985168_g111_i0_p6_ORF_typecomplete_len113_score6_92Exo5/PF09810_9/2e13_NODE_125_length_13349_cov_24_985168_g111_i061399